MASRFVPLYLLVSSALVGQAPSSDTQPAGTTFQHFGQIDSQVFVGSKPHTNKDFEYLQTQHVKYVLNARFLPFLSGSEKRMAKQHGMTFLSVPMNASPIAPSEKHVNRLLLTMKDAQYQPIYLHCVLGRDRTSLLSGLYRIYFLGVSKGEAWNEMKQSGFRTTWFLYGLKYYLEYHAGRPLPPSTSSKP
jgi:protein tyrosine/serine phosphatase